jgi:hypothetical protein
MRELSKYIISECGFQPINEAEFIIWFMIKKNEQELILVNSFIFLNSRMPSGQKIFDFYNFITIIVCI